MVNLIKRMNEFSLMIVDDDEADRYLLKRIIKSGGIDSPIFEETDGAAAFEFLANYVENKNSHGELFPPLVVFLDINMPRMNGFEFLRKFDELRNGKVEYGTIVFLMVTSSENENDLEQARQFDFVKEYIKKFPENGDELRTKLETCLATM